VNTGAIDDLNALADICREYDLWLHVDGAFGAFARITKRYGHLLDGLERADSIGFDLHKWMYLPFEIACVLIRDGQAHRDAFAMNASYIAEASRGVIAGGLPFAERGLELTRNFRALKVWMCMKAFGVETFAKLIEQNIDQARYLTQLIDGEWAPEDSLPHVTTGHIWSAGDSPAPRADSALKSDCGAQSASAPRGAHGHLELVAPVSLNVVCFRYTADLDETTLNTLNEELLLRLQESGVAVPSGTTIDGKFCLRAAIVNHRSRRSDFDTLVEATTRLGRQLFHEMSKS
jgi:glutamate/tyrosine decarboxylase-like PLP-dependent enzyme